MSFCLPYLTRLTLPIFLTLPNLLATGCTSRPDRPPQGSPGAQPARVVAPATTTVVTIEANDYMFTLPARVPAGVVTFRLVNQGKELHHAQVIRLEDGKTASDYLAAFSDSRAMPDWVKHAGGPAGTPPGQEYLSTALLVPGHYLLVCRVVAPDGIMHLTKGMIREFDVVGSGSGVTDFLPSGTDTVILVDYAFASTRPLTAGRHTVRVVNTATQPHEIVMLKLAPGKTPADFARWGLAGRHGPAPGMPVGGVEFIEPGEGGVFPVNLVPGDYGFICFVPDKTDGKRHFLHGMMTQFTVR